MSEAEKVLRAIYAHAEPRARASEPAIGCVEWAATFGPMVRAALGDVFTSGHDAYDRTGT